MLKNNFGEISQKSKSHKADFIVIGVIAVLVLLLFIMAQRTGKVILPSTVGDGAVWKQVYNDEKTVILSDEGYTSADEYTFKYRAASTGRSVIIEYAYVDAETGEEIADRVFWKITTNWIGFVSTEQVDGSTAVTAGYATDVQVTE